MPDAESIYFDGYRWNRYPNAPRRSDRVYFKRSVTGGTVWLHRYVWEKANGEIPKGYHVHHKDGNPSNNALENLECIPCREHCHRHPMVGERYENQLKLLDRIRDSTKAWHGSEEGKKWHSEHAIAGGFGRPDLPERKCDQCGKTFKPKTNHDRFCSNACKSAYRRANGLDDVQKPCELCGKLFTSNKYAKVRFCCRSCAGKYRAEKARTKGLRLDS